MGVKTRVVKRLNVVLSGEDTSDEFEHLTEADRSAIKAILDETLETRRWKILADFKKVFGSISELGKVTKGTVFLGCW